MINWTRLPHLDSEQKYIGQQKMDVLFKFIQTSEHFCYIRNDRRKIILANGYNADINALGVKRCRIKAQDRKEWSAILGRLRLNYKGREEEEWLYREPGSSVSLVTGWTTGRSRFDPRQRRKDFSSSLCVQTGCGAHPPSCTMGTGDLFPGGKARPGVTLTTYPHLVPM
jgi:hypothetical protein